MRCWRNDGAADTALWSQSDVYHIQRPAASHFICWAGRGTEADAHLILSHACPPPVLSRPLLTNYSPPPSFSRGDAVSVPALVGWSFAAACPVC